MQKDQEQPPEPESSADERPVGWGDEERSSENDPDVERLLAERPPHHDRD